MKGGFRIRLSRTYRIARQELKCYLCFIVGRVRIVTRFDSKKPHRLEIGSARSQKLGFITSDLNLHSDFPYDFTAGLPFPDDSIDFIYAEHVLEHFSYRDLVLLVADCRRVLRKGGTMSISVPDARLYIDAYATNATLDLDRFAKYRFGLTFASRMDYLNHIFYMDGQHRYMFDPQGLMALFSDAGFGRAWLRDFDPQLDQEARKHMSLFAAAEK
jgi:predicted SAM-dependent methyltransferase